MKKLIVSLSLLLVAVFGMLAFTNTSDVEADDNGARVTECKKKDDKPVRDGDPIDGVVLF